MTQALLQPTLRAAASILVQFVSKRDKFLVQFVSDLHPYDVFVVVRSITYLVIMFKSLLQSPFPLLPLSSAALILAQSALKM